jgi:hypothetical protein
MWSNNSTEAEGQMKTPSRSGYRDRRLLQFRLRTLLAVFLLAPLAVGWWQMKARQYRAQHVALTDLKPYVTFQPGRPAWLSPFGDEKVFQDVVHLSFQGQREFDDDDAVQLARLPRLRRLSLQNTYISDDGLRYLSKLQELDTLSLDDTLVTDEGLKHLRDLKKLRVLQVGDNKLGGRGLEHLARLPLLERVEVANLGTRDADVRVFSQLPHLRELQVWVTKLSDEGYQDLSSLRLLTNLEHLSLAGAGVLPEEVLLLQELAKLKQIGLKYRSWPPAERLKLEAEIQPIAISEEPRLIGVDSGRAGLRGARTPMSRTKSVRTRSDRY